MSDPTDAPVVPSHDALTLTVVLDRLGLGHRPAAPPRSARHEILDTDGNVIFTGTAHDVWAWLRATGRHA